MTTIPSEAKHTLVIDDNEEEFIKIKNCIRESDAFTSDISWEPDYEKGIERLLDHSHDLYIIDQKVKDRIEIDLLQFLTKHSCEEPVVILTDEMSFADRRTMEDCSAVFLLRRDITSWNLKSAIAYALERSAFLKRLHSHQRKYQHLFERSKDGVFVTNKNFVVQTVNSTAVKVLEYSREELMGRSIFELMEPDKRVSFNGEQLLADGEIEDLEVEFLTKDNKRKSCILSVYLDEGSHEQDYNILGILHDITHLKKTESMSEAEKILFTLVLEVRNTLNNINLTLGQLSVDTLSAEMRTHFEIILRNVKQILKLISALTSQSNPAAIYLKRKPLQSVMDEAIEDVIDLIIEKKINLVIQYEKEPSFSQIDRERVKAAFVNIILNAIDSVPEKSGKLQIEIKRKAGKHIVEISDNRYLRNAIISRKNPVTLMNSLSILQASRVQVDVSSASQIGTTFTMAFAPA